MESSNITPGLKPLLILQVSLGRLSRLLIAVSPVPLPVPGMQQHSTNIC